MSVAVSPYLAPVQALDFHHQEQQTDLLDALLASCQKSAMNARLPGYGRNLQPYFTTEIVAPRLDTVTAAPMTLKGKSRQRKSKGKSSQSSSDEEMPAKRPPNMHQKAQASPETTKCQTIKAIHKQTKAASNAGSPWAGPTFGIAPAATEIPAPSDFLLD